MTHKESVKIDGIEYEVEFEVEPAQKGGWEDESWPAHVCELSIYLDDGADGKSYISEDEIEIYSSIDKLLNKKLLERLV